MTLVNDTILITGGGTGIGLALAKQLLERGNKVIACGRTEASLAEARSRLPSLITYRCDVADAASRTKLVLWLAMNHPEINVLINNAGIQHAHDFTGSVPGDEVAAQIAVNLAAPILLTSGLLPTLMAKPRSMVVNITSGLAFCPLAAIPVYCATKAALHSFTLSLRHQLAGTSVRVVEMAPPLVETRLAGMPRADGPPMLSPDDFATDALAQLDAGKDEITVGIATGIRANGEAMFAAMNG